MTELKTKRLTLRPFQKEDSLPFHEIFSNETAMRYWSTPPHQSLQQTQHFVDQTIQATSHGSGHDFVVLFEDRIIGKMGLWNNFEIGFIFAPDVWGRGFAHEALQALIQFATSRNHRIITADVDPRNSAAIKLLTKNNFVPTGQAKNTMQVGSTWVDSQYFVLYLSQ